MSAAIPEVFVSCQRLVSRRILQPVRELFHVRFCGSAIVLERAQPRHASFTMIHARDDRLERESGGFDQSQSKFKLRS
ncbi:hypothetical protein E4U42_003162 [Claviceps africana]|uniref:Uncharacterized protein n=1 Tax=Claviceps africana TaxID=83212 RepID=A0A8K0J771_9HYPO|nr:hypothetical protein E4U42_003162 [Claviceps africana]